MIPIPEVIAKMGIYAKYTYLTIGGIVLLYALRAIIMWFYEMIFMGEKNLLKRYGNKSWALVTGATDGIGWEFCK